MLIEVLKDIFLSRKGGPIGQSAAALLADRDADARRVLNVGGGSKLIPIPDCYNGWDHLLLDIDPKGGADLVCDARSLDTFPRESFDAVYCSHNLEHYYRHNVFKVLHGFLHVLKSDGFAEIRVPDIAAVMHHVVANNMDIDDVLYVAPVGPITVRDVLYGYGREIEQSGQDFYAHKTGFMPRSLARVLSDAGFKSIEFGDPAPFEIRVYAFKSAITPSYRSLLKLGQK